MSDRPPWRPPSWTTVSVLSAAFVAMYVVDALATLELIKRGAEEASPLPQQAIGIGPLFFFGWKACLGVFGGLLFAFGTRRHRWCWWSFVAVLCAMTALTLLHVCFLLLVPRPYGA